MCLSHEGASVAEQLNLIKLSVGTESVEGLAAWQESRAHLYADGYHRHTTRMWPKREDDVLLGGSIYWVIKGVILCRQRLVRFDETRGSDGIRRCTFVMERPLVRVAPTPKRAFQGWRYLTSADAPPDLTQGRADETPLPPKLSAALAEIGVL